MKLEMLTVHTQYMLLPIVVHFIVASVKCNLFSVFHTDVKLSCMSDIYVCLTMLKYLLCIGKYALVMNLLLIDNHIHESI